MFNETHSFKVNEKQVKLTFIKSKNIQAFPCGRRRSTPIADGNDSRIPFDPEARLNTEANNRKQSSINGFTQTYLEHWDDKNLSLALAGYLFNITLDDNYKTAAGFGSEVAKNAGDKSSIYANILINSTQLFSGSYKGSALAYYTGVLDGWTDKDLRTDSALDLLPAGASGDTALDNYYFSGLAFSVEPMATLYRLEGAAGLDELDFQTRDEYNYVEVDEKTGEKTIDKKIISLRILDNVDGTWKIHEPARLPKIEHGETVDSIVLGDTLVKDDLTVENHTKSKTVEVTDTITTENVVVNKATIGEEVVTNADIETADINTLTGASATYATIKGTTLIEGKELLQDGYKVPTIELDTLSDGTYQLKISRIGSKS